MIYGMYNGVKTTAEPGLVGVCPCCNKEIISKCGDINIWHWAHKNLGECNHKPETEWHRSWKTVMNSDQCEVKMIKNGVTKIADVVLKNGVVIEFQNSPISIKEVIEREAFYGRMFWVLNYTDRYKWEEENFLVYYDREFRKKYNGDLFCWKWAKKSFLKSKKPIFIECNDNFMYRINFFFKKKWGRFGEGVYGVCTKAPIHEFVDYMKNK